MRISHPSWAAACADERWEIRKKSGTVRSAEALDDDRHALAAADAHRLEAEPAVARLEPVDERGHDPGAGRPERVAQRDGATVHVELVRVHAEVVGAGQHLRGDIDLYEVNEAFAPVPLAWLRETGADPDRLNVNGGAIALGHPLGASGTKLMATLVHALKARGLRYGLQTMCEGGGMANVTIVEAL